jgi:hypothetical protein
MSTPSFTAEHAIHTVPRARWASAPREHADATVVPQFVHCHFDDYPYVVCCNSQTGYCWVQDHSNPKM